MTTTQSNPSSTSQLALISAMIAQARGKVERGSFYFLLWGWVTISCELGFYVLDAFTAYPRPYLIWLLTIPAWLLTIWKSRSTRRSSGAYTYVDRALSILWYAFGISLAIVIGFGHEINYNLNPILIVMAAMATFVSGTMLRFKPLQWGGVALWICGIVCFSVDVQTSYLAAALGIAAGYLVPGYMLKHTTAATP